MSDLIASTASVHYIRFGEVYPTSVFKYQGSTWVKTTDRKGEIITPPDRAGYVSIFSEEAWVLETGEIINE